MNKWLDSTVNTYIKSFMAADNPIIYEVGSRDGKDGHELAQRIMLPHDDINNATVVLFECNPPQQAVIRQDFPNATLITDAISTKKGKAKFMQLHGDINVIGSSSMDLNRSKLPWGKDNSVIEVNTRRLDDVIEELGHQKLDIDVMKIDIEGYTYEALESLGKYLRNVKVFHLETEIEGVARNKTNLDIALFMQEKGYICVALEHEWGDTIQDQVWLRQ